MRNFDQMTPPGKWKVWMYDHQATVPKWIVHSIVDTNIEAHAVRRQLQSTWPWGLVVTRSSVTAIEMIEEES